MFNVDRMYAAPLPVHLHEAVPLMAHRRSTRARIFTISSMVLQYCNYCSLSECDIGTTLPPRYRIYLVYYRGVISTFSWGTNFFFVFFNATGLLKNWKIQHFICSNLTLFIVPFFLSFFSFFSFFFFSSFFFLGGDGPHAPSNDAPG